MSVNRVAVFALCASLIVSAQESKLPAIGTAMEEMIAKNEIAGAVTAVVSRDRVLHLEATGLADVAAKRAMTPDTLFWIASMTKPVTGVAVLMLQDEGKLVGQRPGREVSAGVRQPEDAIGQAGQSHDHADPHAHVGPRRGARPGGARGQDAERSRAALARRADAVRARRAVEVHTERHQRRRAHRRSGERHDLRRVRAEAAFRSAGDEGHDLLSDRRAAGAASHGLREEQGDRRARARAAARRFRDRAIARRRATAVCIRRRPITLRFCQMLLNGGTFEGRRYLSAAAMEFLTTPQTGDLPTGFFQNDTYGNRGTNYGWGISTSFLRTPHDGVAAMLSPGTYGHGGAWGTQAWIDPVKGRRLHPDGAALEFPE